jgi:hypothetical protein
MRSSPSTSTDTIRCQPHSESWAVPASIGCCLSLPWDSVRNVLLLLAKAFQYRWNQRSGTVSGVELVQTWVTVPSRRRSTSP